MSRLTLAECSCDESKKPQKERDWTTVLDHRTMTCLVVCRKCWHQWRTEATNVKGVIEQQWRKACSEL